MDTTSKIMMHILDDLYLGDGTRLEGEYSKYYESLDQEQSRAVVTDAIKKLLKENSDATCDFGETTFTLKARD